MVERLKSAIERAREKRNVSQTLEAAAPPAASADWRAAPEVGLDPATLAAGRVVALERRDPANVPFDILRTRILKLLRDEKIARIGVTSPSKGCGKTVVAANLALSLARQRDHKAILLDMDLRAPRLASTLGLRARASMRAFLTGETDIADCLSRVGENLLLFVNETVEHDAAELMHSREAARVLADMRRRYAPDILIYDLPPLPTSDDVIGFTPNLDGALLVAAAGATLPSEIQDCERQLSGAAPLMGVILNKVEGDAEGVYQTDYA